MLSVPNLDLTPLCSSNFKSGPPCDQAQVATKFLDNLLKRYVLKRKIIFGKFTNGNSNLQIQSKLANVMCLFANVIEQKNVDKLHVVSVIVSFC